MDNFQTAFILEENIGSCKCAEYNPFSYDGVLRHHTFIEHKYSNMKINSFLQEEYLYFYFQIFGFGDFFRYFSSQDYIYEERKGKRNHDQREISPIRNF